MKDVENFIKHFNSSENTFEALSCDCSYWFAIILFVRFIRNGATIMYNEENVHFGARINGGVYDISGDVTDKYNWIPWESIQNDSNRERIVRENIMI